MAEASSENFKCEAIDSCFSECQTVKMSFKWTIENFFELQQVNGEKLQSEVFPSAVTQPAYWKLGIYPKGKNKENEDSVVLSLYLQSSQSSNVRARFTLESEDINETRIAGRFSCLFTFCRASSGRGYCFVKRDLLTELLKKSKTDTLVIHCSIIIFLDICHHSFFEPIDSCISKKEKFKICYKWTIKDFLELPHVKGEAIESKVIPSPNEQPANWKLRVYLKGDNEADEGSVSLYLQQQFSELEKVSTKVTFVAEDIDGMTVVAPKSEFHTFDEVSKDFGYRDYINHNSLRASLKRSNSDTLIIHCSIIVYLDICNIPASGSGVSMKVSNETRLSKDLHGLLLDESYSDFVINIDDRKFKVHKCILHTRSPVFAAMLSSNMKEGDSSEVTLDDVDPNVFEKVLRFIYTDKLAMIDSDALAIIPVADKYNLVSLKQECIDVLRIRICKSNAVKTLILADAHNLTKLKKVAVRYICWNADVISKTEDWSLLVASYPKLVAELFLALAVDKT